MEQSERAILDIYTRARKVTTRRTSIGARHGIAASKSARLADQGHGWIRAKRNDEAIRQREQKMESARHTIFEPTELQC